MFAADLNSEWLILIQILGDRRVNFLRPACGILESIEMRLHHDPRPLVGLDVFVPVVGGALSKTIIMTKAKLDASDSEDDEDYVPPAEDGE